MLLEQQELESPQKPRVSTRVVLERAGERSVSDPEYAALLTGGAHLLLDLTTTAEHGGFTAHVRADGKKPRAVALPAPTAKDTAPKHVGNSGANDNNKPKQMPHQRKLP